MSEPLILQWANVALRFLLDAFLSPGATVNYHRDYGDEDDFDVVCAQVNQKPKVVAVDPVVGISRADRMAAVLEQGVSVGDFVLHADGSLQPVVPEPGQINRTWVRVLIGELLIATGRDPEAPDLVSVPDRTADLLRDLVCR